MAAANPPAPQGPSAAATPTLGKLAMAAACVLPAAPGDAYMAPGFAPTGVDPQPHVGAHRAPRAVARGLTVLHGGRGSG